MPLNMTKSSQLRVLGALKKHVSAGEVYSSVVLGMGDGLALALSAELGAYSVGGVEICSYKPECIAQRHAERMLEISGIPTNQAFLFWGMDGADLHSLDDLCSEGTHSILAYSLDDSIPLVTRKHWYRLAEANERVCAIATCHHHSLNLLEMLPSFECTASFRVRLEGGRCNRTMRVLKRK